MVKFYNSVSSNILTPKELQFINKGVDRREKKMHVLLTKAMTQLLFPTRERKTLCLHGVNLVGLDHWNFMVSVHVSSK